jgi:hypothetical protein
MSGLVFFVEEPSMKELLNGVLPRLLPDGLNWLIIEHEGKSDLKLSVPRKIRAWGVPGTRFIVLIDQDSNDCKKLKRDLLRLCAEAGNKGALVRIVCRALESWVLGDLEAAGRALGNQQLARRQLTRKYRDPDKLGDPIREIQSLHPTYQKVAGARAVGRHLRLEPGASRSRSFEAFLSGLKRLLREGGS